MTARDRLAELERQFADPRSSMHPATFSAKCDELAPLVAVEFEQERERERAAFVEQSRRVPGEGTTGDESDPRHRGAMLAIEAMHFAADGARIIEGVASRPVENSHDTTYDPLGMECDLPLPLLVSHDYARVVGKVTSLTKSAAEVRFAAQIANTPDGDRAWAEITAGELPDVSLAAFWAVHHERDSSLFARWRARELSVCRSGACPGARIERAYELGADGRRVERSIGTATLRRPEPLHLKAAADVDRIAKLEARIVELQGLIDAGSAARESLERRASRHAEHLARLETRLKSLEHK